MLLISYRVFIPFVLLQITLDVLAQKPVNQSYLILWLKQFHEPFNPRKCNPLYKNNIQWARITQQKRLATSE